MFNREPNIRSATDFLNFLKVGHPSEQALQHFFQVGKETIEFLYPPYYKYSESGPSNNLKENILWLKHKYELRRRHLDEASLYRPLRYLPIPFILFAFSPKSLTADKDTIIGSELTKNVAPFGIFFGLAMLMFLYAMGEDNRTHKETFDAFKRMGKLQEYKIICDEWILLLDKMVYLVDPSQKMMSTTQATEVEISKVLKSAEFQNTNTRNDAKEVSQNKPHTNHITKDISVDFILERFKNLKKLSEEVAFEIVKIGQRQIDTWQNKYKKFHFPTLQPASSNTSGNLKEQLKWMTETFNKLKDFFSHPDKQSQGWHFLCFKKKSIDSDETNQILGISKKWLDVTLKLIDLMAANKIKKKSTDGKHKSKKRKSTSIKVKPPKKIAANPFPNTSSTSENGKPKIGVMENGISAPQIETKIVSPVKPLGLGEVNQPTPVKSLLHQVDPRSQLFSGEQFATCVDINGKLHSVGWKYTFYARDANGDLHDVTSPVQKSQSSPKEKIVDLQNKEFIPARRTQEVSQSQVLSDQEIIKTKPVDIVTKNSESVQVQPVINQEATTPLQVVKLTPSLLTVQSSGLANKTAVNSTAGQVSNVISQSTSAAQELALEKTGPANSTFTLFAMQTSDLTTHILSDYNGEQNGVEEDSQTPVLEVNESDSEPDSDSEWSYVFQTKKSR